MQESKVQGNAPPIPPLVLGGPSDEGPVHADGLTHQVLTVQTLHGCLGLFVGLVLHQSVTLTTRGRKTEVFNQL